MLSVTQPHHYRLLPLHLIVLLFCMLLFACSNVNSDQRVLRLGTTTSVENSGLLNELLPDFEAMYQVEVEVVAVGTGQALALAERGDVDIVIVHAPQLEIEFVQSGFGVARYDLMYNDFIIVGPSLDPADIKESDNAAEAFSAISRSEATFLSRGDQSGTHVREIELWNNAVQYGIESVLNEAWYISVGQGMGVTLNMANEIGAYTLSDRATFLAQQENIPNLQILFGGASLAFNPDPELINYYSLLPVNPLKHPNINVELVSQFIDWITSYETQAKIQQYQSGISLTPLFYANSLVWRESEGNQSPIQSTGISKASSIKFWDSLQIIFSGNSSFVEIIVRTIQVSGAALFIACLLGIPLGAILGLSEFKGKGIIQILVYTGMGLPPVVVGLILFLLLSNQGLLGKLNWLFTMNGMILAQSVLALPITIGITWSSVRAVSKNLILQIRSLGASDWQVRWSILNQARLGVIASVLAAFGRIISEVGAVMLVGGNIAGNTRVLSTAIILETRQGSFELALALGMVLLGVALLSNILVMRFGGKWNL